MTGFLTHELSSGPARDLLVPAQRTGRDDRGALPLSLAEITSAAMFDAVSSPASDLVLNGRLMKFLIDRRLPEEPRVHFVNGNFTMGGVTPDSARYHYYFAQAALGIPDTLEEFNLGTYFTQNKKYVAGLVHTYLLDGRTEPVYGIQFYPQDVIREDTVVEATTLVKDKLAIPGATYAFVPTGTQQTTVSVATELDGAGLSVVSLDSILGSIDYLPLNQGEAWGHLRIFPADLDELRPTDIPVFEELPLDLSVVAGVLTKSVQDTNSHVNLKSKERGTPNAVLRDAGPDNPRLAPYDGQPVHLVVRGDDFLIEDTTEEIVEAKLAERMDRPVVRFEWDPETELRSYDELGAGTTQETLASARRYGSKATNLGFLAHREVLGRVGDKGSPSAKAGYDLVPRGFAVPFSVYQQFLDHPPNTALREKLAALITAEEAGDVSPKDRAARVGDLQAAFMAASFPPEALALLHQRLGEVLPGVGKIKVRSSANAEDVPDFDGAGLHDSFSAETARTDDPDRPCQVVDDAGVSADVKRKVKPRSVLCAVKGVYASLWNKRAIEERAFARIDQSSVAMGLAIVPAYDHDSDVVANAVVVTRVLNTQDVYGYSLSVQQGNNLVTNPDPGTHSEVTVAGFISDSEPVSLTVTRFAQPTREGPGLTHMVLLRERMVELVDLAKRVERAYCRAKPAYYDGSCTRVTADNEKQKSLDLELKLLENGHLVCKQVREFGGS